MATGCPRIDESEPRARTRREKRCETHTGFRASCGVKRRCGADAPVRTFNKRPRFLTWVRAMLWGDGLWFRASRGSRVILSPSTELRASSVCGAEGTRILFLPCVQRHAPGAM